MTRLARASVATIYQRFSPHAVTRTLGGGVRVTQLINPNSKAGWTRCILFVWC